MGGNVGYPVSTDEVVMDEAVTDEVNEMKVLESGVELLAAETIV